MPDIARMKWQELDSCGQLHLDWIKLYDSVMMVSLPVPADSEVSAVKYQIHRGEPANALWPLAMPSSVAVWPLLQNKSGFYEYYICMLMDNFQMVCRVKSPEIT